MLTSEVEIAIQAWRSHSDCRLKLTREKKAHDECAKSLTWQRVIDLARRLLFINNSKQRSIKPLALGVSPWQLERQGQI